MIGCITETTTCVLAKSLVSINDLYAKKIGLYFLYSNVLVKGFGKNLVNLAEEEPLML